MSRWWRAYDEAVDDPKLQRLTGDQFKTWFNLCCLASQNDGILPSLDDIAFKLRMKPGKLHEVMDALRIVGLLDDNPETGTSPHNWNGRQYKSDVSTPRVKRFREQQRNVSPTVTETPPETEADTESETEKKPSLRSGPPKSRGTRLPDDWKPNDRNISYAKSKGFSDERIAVIGEKFRNHWTAKAGKDACKVDWDRTWENWILNETERGNVPASNARTAATAGPSKTGADAILAGMGNVARRRFGGEPPARSVRELPGHADPADDDDPIVGRNAGDQQSYSQFALLAGPDPGKKFGS